MYHRAFIIDDNKYAVEAAYHAFPWAELNVRQIDKIYTTSSLVERILNERPCLVFIDIEMHDVSGLDVIMECKERGSNSLFIIISGHDNFNYAHTAVNLGVVYYLLKPIDADDVNILTQKLKKTLAEMEASNLSDYLSTEEGFHSYLSSRLKGQSYRFLICNLTDGQRLDIHNMIQDFVSETYKIGKRKYLFIISDNGVNQHMLNKLNAYAQEQQIVLSLSGIFDKNGCVYDNFVRTNQLSYHYFLRQSGCLIIDRMDFPDTTILKNVLDSLFHAIDAKYLQGIENILQSLPALFGEQHYTMAHVTWFYNALISRINIIYNKNRAFPFSQMDEEDLQTHFQDFSILCSTLLAYLKEMLVIENKLTENSNELWGKILSFIEENYNKKIQAQDICSTLYISTRTLYNVFKANSDVTFIEYLTHFRIEKAKQLLKTTPMSITEIADAIGIKDHYYFNKIFKKNTGVTPLKYKAERGNIT